MTTGSDVTASRSGFTARSGMIGRGAARLTPLVVHVASIVVAFAVIGYLGRDQWFFYDDWAFVVPRGPGLLTPHGGHLSILADLIMHGIRAIFGVRTYAPYLAFAVGTHLLLAHLLWRVMIRTRVDPWIATTLAFLLMVLGAGSENIFWAFQLGFMGAMCCGVATVLLVTRDRWDRTSGIAVAVITGVGLATSGTSLPIVAAAILLSLKFRGLRTTALIYVGPVGLYLLWYIEKPFVAYQIATPHSLHEALTFIPSYVGRMFSAGFDVAIPVPGIGAVVVACLVAWVGVRAPQFGRREHAIPAALLGSALVFAALTAYSRFGIGLVAATSGRYIYFVIAASLPAIGAGATALARRRTPSRALVIVLVLATIAYNIGLLISGANAQSIIEQGSRREIYAALDFTLKHPSDVDPHVPVDSKWAHALTAPGLVSMHEHGWINVGHYRPTDMLNALDDIAIRIVPSQAVTVCAPPGSGPIVIAVGGTLTFYLPHLEGFALRVAGDGTSMSRPRQFNVPAGKFQIDNMTGRPVILASPPPGMTFCQSS